MSALVYLIGWKPEIESCEYELAEARSASEAMEGFTSLNCVIGIQTRLDGVYRGPIVQGGISSPFHQPVSAAIRCGTRESIVYGGARCTLEHGHVGAHVYESQETRDQEARP